MKVDRIKCDVCGAVVEMAAPQQGVILLARPLAADNTRTEVSVRWRVEFSSRDSEQHFCAACVANALALAASQAGGPYP